MDNRFCFEGGSQCGKGEGLYVLVTDQGDEITHTLKVASQGKLATKRRPVARKLSGKSHKKTFPIGKENPYIFFSIQLSIALESFHHALLKMG